MWAKLYQVRDNLLQADTKRPEDLKVNSRHPLPLRDRLQQEERWPGRQLTKTSPAVL